MTSSQSQTDRKKPGLAFWATVVVVALLVAYPLSFGPACWWTSRHGVSKWLPDAYWPFGWCAAHSDAAENLMRTYARLGMRQHSKVYVPNKGGWGFRINKYE